jgi:hypothetical protein
LDRANPNPWHGRPSSFFHEHRARNRRKSQLIRSLSPFPGDIDAAARFQCLEINIL